MATATRREYRSDMVRRWVLVGREEGLAEGEANALLKVLAARGVTVPDEDRERILACSDVAQLDTWLDRAATATSASELFDAGP